jgi:hypothetical protein
VIITTTAATLTREELVTYVLRAAHAVALKPEHTARLVLAVADPVVTRVSRGSFQHVDLETGTFCRCPVELAYPGFGTRDDGEDTTDDDGPLLGFAGAFDRLTRHLPGADNASLIAISS